MRLISIILFFYCTVIPIINGQINALDTVDVLDDKGRVVKKISNGLIIQEIEYLPSIPKTVADLTLKLPYTKSEQINYSFEEGDTLLVEIRPFGHNIIRSVTLADSKGGIVLAGADIKKGQCFCKRIVIEKTDDYILDLLDKYSFTRDKVTVKIDRYPKLNPQIYDVYRDTIFSDSADLVISHEVVSRDTLVFQLADLSTTISNTLDFEQDPYQIVPITIPYDQKNAIEELVYWIGLSAEDTIAYQRLEERVTLPPDLLPLSSTPSLVAYQLDRRIPLPATANTNVEFGFSDVQHKLQFKSSNKLSSNFGRISLQNLQLKHPLHPIKTPGKETIEAYQFLVNFKNNSSVNTYPIQVKMIGFGVQTQTQAVTTKSIKSIKKYRILRESQIEAANEK